MSDPITEELRAKTLAAPDFDDHEAMCVDAEQAHQGINALVELLRGCPPGYQITAGALLGLIVGVKSYLDNVVDGLQVTRYH
jgi:hypothetical protein